MRSIAPYTMTRSAPIALSQRRNWARPGETDCHSWKRLAIDHGQTISMFKSTNLMDQPLIKKKTHSDCATFEKGGNNPRNPDCSVTSLQPSPAIIDTLPLPVSYYFSCKRFEVMLSSEEPGDLADLKRELMLVCRPGHDWSIDMFRAVLLLPVLVHVLVSTRQGLWYFINGSTRLASNEH